MKQRSLPDGLAMLGGPLGRLQRYVAAVLLMAVVLLPLGPSLALAEDTITTGDAQSTTEIDTALNANDIQTGSETDVDITNESSSETVVEGSADSGNNQQSEGLGQVEVTTGDAEVGTVVGNDVNTTNVGVDDAHANSTPSLLDDTTTEVHIDNTADVSNTVTANANSGSNTSHDNVANVYIDSGDVNVYTDLFNMINSTVLGSDNIKIINIYHTPTNGIIDLSGFNSSPTSTNEIVDLGANAATTTSSGTAVHAAGLLGDDTASTALNIDNSATLTNDIAINANSGLNTATSTYGNVRIETGHVNIDTSVFNMVNTTIAGENWDFKVLNIFSDWSGDVILPVISDRHTAAGCSGCTNFIGLQTGNSADVSTNITTDLSSGDNTITNAVGSAAIDTGDVTSNASTFNLVDTNVTGDDWYYTQLNVQGSWGGQVYNAPSTAQFIDHGPNNAGIMAGSATSSPTLVEGTLNNNATVQNNIAINGNSGGNQVDYAGNAIIRTGDVTANTAVANVVNTTIYGDNWKFYLINVFGNWSGGLHYGMPDLAVSELAVPEMSPIGRGQMITYTFSYVNGGDATAQNVILEDTFDPERIRVIQPNGGEVGDGTIRWRLGSVRPGETRVFGYVVQMYGQQGGYPIQNTARITDSNKDRNQLNNTTGGTIAVMPLGYTRSYGPGWMPNPDFTLKKTSDVAEVQAGGEVKYSIKIKNHSLGSGYNVALLDTMYDGSGKEIGRKAWKLDQVYAKEEISVDYTIPFPDSALPGEYINKVRLYAWNFEDDQMPFVDASAVVAVRPGEPTIATTTAEFLATSTPYFALGTLGDEIGTNEPPQPASAPVTTSSKFRVITAARPAAAVKKSQPSTMHTDRVQIASAVKAEQPVKQDTAQSRTVTSKNPMGWLFSAVGSIMKKIGLPWG